MIFDNKDNEFKEIDIHKLSEESIRIITQLESMLDHDSSISEFYSYIDNLIDYYTHKTNMFLKFSRNQIDRIYDFKRNIRKFLKNNPDTCYELLIPNNYFNKYPNKVIIESDKYLNTWNFKNNKKYKVFNNVFSSYYNNIIKNMTEGKITKFSEIDDKLLDIITTKKKVIEDNCNEYLDKMIIPQDGIQLICNFIGKYIESLNRLKSISLLDINNSINDINKCVIESLKMLEVKTTYVNIMINILFSFYLNKIKIFDINTDKKDIEVTMIMNETFYEMFNNNFKILDEASAHYDFGYDSDKLAHINGEYYLATCDNLEAIKKYIEILYKQAIYIIDKQYNYDYLKYLDYFSIKNKKFLNMKVQDIKEYNNFIINNKNFLKIWRSDNLDIQNNIHDRELILSIIDKKDEIKESITNDYNCIMEYLETIKGNNFSKDFSDLYNEYFPNLSMFTISEIETLENKLSLLGIEVYPILYSNTEYGKTIRMINDKYNKDNPQQIIQMLDRCILLKRQFRKQFNFCLDPVGINNKLLRNYTEQLLAYLIFFQNKVFEISII